MRILRTFYIPAKNTERTLTITESVLPDSVIISCGEESVLLSKEAFHAMCDLRYKIEWVEEETDNV